MDIEEVVGLIGHTIKPHMDQVFGFAKALDINGMLVEGLLITYEGVEYVLPIVTRAEFQTMIREPVQKGFALYEFGDGDRVIGGES